MYTFDEVSGYSTKEYSTVGNLNEMEHIFLICTYTFCYVFVCHHAYHLNDNLHVNDNVKVNDSRYLKCCWLVFQLCL